MVQAVLYVDIKGLAICDPTPTSASASGGEETFTVVRHYPFTRIRSWTNEGAGCLRARIPERYRLTNTDVFRSS